jgi:adenylate kinase family enzyme
MKNLILLRGLPGAGKSTVAKLIGADGAGYAHYEADMFFMKDGEYKFEPTQIKMAHNWCQIQTEKAMANDTYIVIVSNTFTQEWEMERYLELAKYYDYQVTSLVVENRHNGTNVHGVPQDKLEIMKERFQVKL